MEQELQSLRAENKSLKQEVEILKSSTPGGVEASRHFHQLQTELVALRQQLQHAQNELSTVRANSPSSSSIAAPSTLSSSTAASTTAETSNEVIQLRRQLNELESEHEDLLILLASQEIELEAARKQTQPSQQPTSANSVESKLLTQQTNRPTSIQTPTPAPQQTAMASMSMKPHLNGADSSTQLQQPQAHDIDLR